MSKTTSGLPILFGACGHPNQDGGPHELQDDILPSILRHIYAKSQELCIVGTCMLRRVFACGGGGGGR